MIAGCMKAITDYNVVMGTQRRAKVALSIVLRHHIEVVQFFETMYKKKLVKISLKYFWL